MRATRSQAIALVLIVGLLAADAAAIGTGAVRRREEIKHQKADLNSGLVRRSRSLRDLQRQTDDARETVFSAMDSMDELLNLLRTSDGIDRAEGMLPTVAGRMDGGRRANVRLVESTGLLIREAQAGRSDIATLISLGTSDTERRYLESLDEALDLLVQTHRVYQEMNLRLGRGFPDYEELLQISRDFLARKPTFRSYREAASVYDHSTRDIALRITTLQADLNEIRSRAEKLAVSTTAAFLESQRAAGRD